MENPVLKFRNMGTSVQSHVPLDAAADGCFGIASKIISIFQVNGFQQEPDFDMFGFCSNFQLMIFPIKTKMAKRT